MSSKYEQGLREIKVYSYHCAHKIQVGPACKSDCEAIQQNQTTMQAWAF